MEETRLLDLANGRCPVYVATRLFDHSGRYFGARMEQACQDAIKRFLLLKELKVNGVITFLPFRDSNDAAVGIVDKPLTKAIYLIDCKAIVNSFAIFAPVYDLQQDSGIAFEIGYAKANNIPIILLSTNFFKWKVQNHKDLFLFEPTLYYFANQIINAGEFSLAVDDKTFDGYLSKINNAIIDVMAKIEESFFNLCMNGIAKNHFNYRLNSCKMGTIHLEFGGGQYEYQSVLSTILVERLRKSSFSVSVSNRHKNGDLKLGLSADLSKVAESEYVICFADGADVEPEIALIQGFSAGLGKNIILYYSGNKELFSPPDYLSKRNLMLIESSIFIATSLAEIEEYLKRTIGNNE